jgi:hypothetical protein
VSRFPLQKIPAILITLLLAASFGCAAGQIREAQEAFNEAARVENSQRTILGSGVIPIEGSASAALGYRRTLHLVGREIDNHEAKLREQRLLGPALMLRALSVWRLADLEASGAATLPAAARNRNPRPGSVRAAVRAVEARVASGQVTLGTRDKVMLLALPGLADHDAGLRAESYPVARAYFESAHQVMKVSLTQVQPPENHPIRVYIRLAQLASLRAWHAAVYKMQPRNQRVPEIAAIHSRARSAADDLGARARSDPDLRTAIAAYMRSLGASWALPD